MKNGGFAGKILKVDLTTREIRQEPLDMRLAENFIGGLGLTLKLAYDNIIPGTGALEPENIITIGVGPLVGTNLPATSRVFAVSKLPSSETIGWCGAGGVDFGCQLKKSGFDHIVIQGQADKPVYLKIIDEKRWTDR
jgi:aldehyde:ferredoxin oxidoreductase